VRIFTAGLPAARWSDDPLLAALGPRTAVIYSFRGDVAAAAAGAYDDRLRHFLAGKPTDVTAWVVFHHEPEDEIALGAFTAEQFRAATGHLAPIIRAAGAIPTTVLMQWTLHPESGRHWRDYYSPDIDLLGWDAYNHGRLAATPQYSNPDTIIDPVLDVARQTGKPFGWAEFGSPCLDHDPDCTGRAGWLTAFGTAARTAGAAFAAYWNQTRGVDFRLTDPASTAAYRQLSPSGGEPRLGVRGGPRAARQRIGGPWSSCWLCVFACSSPARPGWAGPEQFERPSDFLSAAMREHVPDKVGRTGMRQGRLAWRPTRLTGC